MTNNHQLPKEGEQRFATEHERCHALDIQTHAEQGEARRQMEASGGAATILSIEAPPMLEAAMGYDGQGRLVAFFWGADDEAYYSDGFCTACAEWDAFLLYTQHATVAPLLKGYDFGSSEADAIHWLILDRETRRLSVARVSLAQPLVQAQWQRPEPGPVIDDEAWTRVCAEIEARAAQITPQQIMEAMQEQRRLLGELRDWLNQQLLTSTGGGQR